MLIRRFFVWMFSIGLMALGAGVVSGQNYPNKPIRIVTNEPGGSSDFSARIIAQGISGPLGQPVIVDNRGGGGSILGVIAARATPDGYTLLVSGSSFWFGPLLKKTPYDPVKDFSPITLANRAPNILVVHPSVPVKSVKELIALAKAKPGELNYASASIGTSPHLAAELFKAMAGVNIVHIPYKGGGPAILALLSGQVQLLFASQASVAPHIKSNKLRAVAITSPKPSALAPGLPTVAASGLPGFESGSTIGMFAPAKTPAAIISRLNREVVRLLNQADVKAQVLSVGSETVGSSSKEFTAYIKSDMAKLGKVIKDANIVAD